MQHRTTAWLLLVGGIAAACGDNEPSKQNSGSGGATGGQGGNAGSSGQGGNAVGGTSGAGQGGDAGEGRAVAGQGGEAGEGPGGQGASAGSVAGSAGSGPGGSAGSLGGDGQGGEGDAGEGGASEGGAGAGGSGGGPVCAAGFELSGTQCVDVDECAASVDDCVSPSACVNTQGSFGCRCPIGQLGDARASGAGCLDLGGLLLWLDGADPSDDQAPPQAGKTIATWIDRSGNGHHAGQGAASRQPTYVQGSNGRGVLRFDGLATPNGDELDVDNSGGEFDLVDATVFVVLSRRYESIGSDPGFFAVRSDFYTRISLHLNTIGQGWLVWNGVSLKVVAEPPFTIGQLYLLDAIWDLGVETRRTNAVVLESVHHPWNGPERFRPLHIGWSGQSAEHFNGDIAEVIVFQNAIAAADRDWVTDYLGGKWNIALP